MWLILATSIWLSFSLPSNCIRQKRPHILFFLVDDLGWNDVGFHGMTQIPTPNIDALAADGMILNNYYVTHLCTPSRASLLTGKYPSTTGNQHNVLMVTQAAGLGLEHVTLPQALNKLGYVSRMVGKWHLGFFRQEYTPTKRGFASHYGFWYGATDFFFHTAKSLPLKANTTLFVPDYDRRETFMFEGLDFRDNLRPVTTLAGKYLTDIYTDEAVKIIEQHPTSKPLFLYLAHHGVHIGDTLLPMRAPKKYTKNFEYIKDDERKNFAGALSAIDTSLGTVLSALERRGILNDTIIVFSADNGSPKVGTFSGNGGSNYPLRGFKFTGWEGGTRAAGFIWTPKLCRPNRTFEGLMHISDWMPTLYSAAGGNVQDLKGLDGFSQWNALQGSTSPRQEVLLVSDPIDNIDSYRFQDFKIISPTWHGIQLDGMVADLDTHGGDPGRETPPRPSSPATSQVAQILKKLYGRPSERLTTFSPILVDCGQPSNGSDFECRSGEVFCLFNVKDDPCEYKNLAATRPEVLANLQAKLKVLKQKVRAPWYPPDDYRSDPLYHGGFWSPWLDQVQDYHAQD